MSKAIIWFLVGIGILLLLIGLFIDITVVWLIGLVMVAGGLYMGLGPGGVLRKEQVLDTWAILIEDAQGNVKKVFKDTESALKASKAPKIDIEQRAIAPSLMRGMMGKKRDFLVVTDRRSFRLRPYQIFMNARDYGNNLDVSWHLTYRPSLWQAIPALFPYVNVIPRTISDLDLFDEQDLRVYATNAHHCLLKAVEKLMLDLNQDPSKIDKKSRGFLGIS